MNSRRAKSKGFCSQHFKVVVEHQIEDFIHDETLKILKFPKTFTREERAYIHEYVIEKNLKSKSYNKGSERYITISKKAQHFISAGYFNVTEASQNLIYQTLKSNPVTDKEITDLCPKPYKKSSGHLPAYRFSVGTFSESYSCVPPRNKNTSFINQRKNLPIFKYRQEILNKISENQVLVISGETGSGKTTQIPQYILEDFSDKNQPCRIICTQPRRLSAISVAERVVQERSESIGQVVGYQIRLESRTSPTSNLIYCTNGILLRCLMGESKKDVFHKVTHIIVDEVHERDKSSDFLLISLKRSLKSYPHLKIILMSATIESEVFSKYFFDCPIMKIPGRLYDVESYFLEDVLGFVNYKNLNSNVNIAVPPVQTREEIEVTDPETVELLNETLENCATSANAEEAFDQFFYLVEGENLPVDYHHTSTDMTALMIASCKGLLGAIKQLLNFGADPKVKTLHGYNAYDWAIRLEQHVVAEFLSEYMHYAPNTKSTQQKNDNAHLLRMYEQTSNDDNIDFKLIYSVIKYIHTSQPSGSILIFLPGYEDIIEMNDRITNGISANDISPNIQIYMLHSSMPTINQKGVFNKPPTGCRKIILSTNIAETSITIDDVVYIIDPGKVKQKTFDAIGGSTCLSSTWISQACATQRAGRAGRTSPGKCYRIYSTIRHDSMAQYSIPEMLRVPLTEICLQTKLIASDTTILDYLSESIQPPTSLSVNQSIRLLVQIGALDEDENLTALGTQLVDLPIDVQLGKILIFSILLKCLDPILSIVSSLSVKDPFIIPTQYSERGAAHKIKKDLSEDTFSDHIAMLRIFQKWLDNKSIKSDKAFCSRNYINPGNMETICGVRTQILGYLRAVGLIQSHGNGNIHDLNYNSNNWAVVKACFVAGLYPNLCSYNKKKRVLASKLENKVLIHSSSVLMNAPVRGQTRVKPELPADWVVYGEKSTVGRMCFVKTCTIVTPITVALFAGPIFQNEKDILQSFFGDDSLSEDDDDDQPLQEWTKFVLDDWISFKLETPIAYLIFNLRQKLYAMFLRFIHNPRNFFKHERDNGILAAIVKILATEDMHTNLKQPSGIGERPKAVILNLSTSLNFGIQNQKDVINNLSNNLSNTSIKNDSLNHNKNKRMNHNVPQASTSMGIPGSSNQMIYGMNPIQIQNFNQHPNHHNQHFNRPITKAAFSETTKVSKYFIVKAASAEQVYSTLGREKWNFSTSVFKKLNKMARTQPPKNVIIFFHVIQSKEFVGAGRFTTFNDRFTIDSITKNSIKFFKTNQNLTRMYDHFRIKSLPQFFDGEEIPQFIGEQFLNDLFKEPQATKSANRKFY